MISENRDIILERLEQKLSSKERDINELRNSLKDSIISELRESMKEDLDFDKRISILERRIKENALAYEGVMKELLDQKTVIQDLKKNYLYKDKNERIRIHKEEPTVEKKVTTPGTQLIIAESEEDTNPSEIKDNSRRNNKKSKNNRSDDDNSDIIIADHTVPRSDSKDNVIVESREDEDVVIEYRI
jgi:hypothetical protein